MWFNFRLTEKEHRRLQRRAKSCGLTMSAYVRQIINGYKPRESPPADYYSMTREIKAIGNNLNQLTFMANATGLIDEAAYFENAAQLRDALKRIEKAVVGTADGTDEDMAGD